MSSLRYRTAITPTTGWHETGLRPSSPIGWASCAIGEWLCPGRRPAELELRKPRNIGSLGRTHASLQLTGDNAGVTPCRPAHDPE